jgi:hypothetical protein
MPKPRPTTAYTVSATVVDGVIRLTGDILNNTIEVTPGESAHVSITDTSDWFLYAAVTSNSGTAGGCWGRTRGSATNLFSEVTSESHCIVYAVSRASAAAVTYGPVITIKPKG